MPLCEPGTHLCPGFPSCVSNTPETGCWKSVTCEPCVAPEHGVAKCTPSGVCDFDCPNYVKEGGSCICPTSYNLGCFTCTDDCLRFNLDVKSCDPGQIFGDNCFCACG